MSQSIQPVSVARKTIVVCDDHPGLLGILRHVLSKQGFEVVTASDGAEGLEILERSRADLLLLDLNMPSVDGLGVLETLSRGKSKRPYTMMISGQESDSKRARALELGAQEIWTKPFIPSQLVDRIQSLQAEGRL